MGTYFRYLRMLFFANLLIFALVVAFIVIPMAGYERESNYSGTYSTDIASGTNLVLACTARMEDYSSNYTDDAATAVASFLDGTVNKDTIADLDQFVRDH